MQLKESCTLNIHIAKTLEYQMILGTQFIMLFKWLRVNNKKEKKISNESQSL